MFFLSKFGDEIIEASLHHVEIPTADPTMIGKGHPQQWKLVIEPIANFAQSIKFREICAKTIENAEDL